MDRRERFEDLSLMLIAALEGWQSNVWTALPGIIQSFDSDAMTVSVQPAIKARVRSRDGNPPVPGAERDGDTPWWWVSLPLLIHCPVVFPNGGGFTFTFPVQPGDEALVVFASRCIDAWWQQGGVAQQADLRMHNLSDGFAIVGPRSVPRAIPGLSLNTAQLRSDDGALYIELAAGHVANIVAPGGLNITGPVNINGDVEISGDTSITGDTAITGDLSETGDTVFTGAVHANGKPVDQTHTHSGVTAGGANSGPVT